MGHADVLGLSDPGEMIYEVPLVQGIVTVVTGVGFLFIASAS